MPWEIRAGKLLRVRDVAASASSLSATARDGISIFRVVEVDYRATTNTATLHLDAPLRAISRR